MRTPLVVTLVGSAVLVLACASRSGSSNEARPSKKADPLWASGTKVATDADMKIVLEHLPPGTANLPAGNVFKDVQLFHGADAKTFVHAMHGFTTAVGEDCKYCHTEKKFEEDTDHKKAGRQMIVMTDDLNRTTFGGEAVITCWTCHQGAKEPEKQPADMQDRIAKAMPPQFKVPAADAEKPAREVFKNMQMLGSVPAGQIPYYMGYFSAAVGEDCDFCHVKDDPASDDNEHKRITREMMRMSGRAAATIEGTRGPITCWGCHRGHEEPPTPPKTAPSTAPDATPAASPAASPSPSPSPSAAPSPAPR